MSGLAGKSLPFSSDGYFIVARPFDLPIMVASSSAEYILQKKSRDLVLGSLNYVHASSELHIIQIRRKELLQLTTAQANIINSNRYTAQIPLRSGLALQTDPGIKGILGGTSIIQLRDDTPLSLGKAESKSDDSAFSSIATFKSSQVIPFGTTPLEGK